MRKLIIITLFQILASASSAMQPESMLIVGRPFITNTLLFNDSLYEVGYRRFNDDQSQYGLWINISDTLCRLGRNLHFDPTPNYVDYVAKSLPINDEEIEIFVGWLGNRSPYMYRFHRSDTGYVEGRLRFIDLPRNTYLLDAFRSASGDYIVAYSIPQGNPVFGHRYYTARVTPDGDVRWRTLIWQYPAIEYIDYGGDTTESGSFDFAGLFPRADDPAVFYIGGHRQFRANIYFDYFEHYFFANVTMIDTSGRIRWRRDYWWADHSRRNEPNRIDVMFPFSDGSFGIVGMRIPNIEVEPWRYAIPHTKYFHVSGDGELLDSARYLTRNHLYSSRAQSFVGTRMVILAYLAPIFPDDEHSEALGLIYADNTGDSLDGFIFHPDTAAPSPHVMLEGPGGKLIVFVLDNDRVSLGYRNRRTDLLYTFYPDGRPGSAPGVGAPLPAGFVLEPIWPNPFNGVASVAFGLPMGMGGQLRVYDLSGRLVSDLSGHIRPAGGLQQVVWDGSRLPAGVYLFRLSSGPWRVERKAALLK